MPRKRGLSVRIPLRPLRTTQNYFRPIPAFVRRKITPCSASSGYSEASAAHSVYGSPYGCRRD